MPLKLKLCQKISLLKFRQKNCFLKLCQEDLTFKTPSKRFAFQPFKGGGEEEEEEEKEEEEKEEEEKEEEEGSGFKVVSEGFQTFVKKICILGFQTRVSDLRQKDLFRQKDLAFARERLRRVLLTNHLRYSSYISSS